MELQLAKAASTGWAILLRSSVSKRRMFSRLLAGPSVVTCLHEMPSGSGSSRTSRRLERWQPPARAPRWWCCPAGTQRCAHTGQRHQLRGIVRSRRLQRPVRRRTARADWACIVVNVIACGSTATSSNSIASVDGACPSIRSPHFCTITPSASPGKSKSCSIGSSRRR